MGLKERFASRQLPRVTVPLRMDHSAESDAAHRELADARGDLASAEARGLVDLVSRTRRVEAAEAAVAVFYEDLVVCGLPIDEYDKLVEAHPATAEQKAKTPGASWNPITFCPALLAACIESNMTESDWAELTSKGPATQGEVGYLFQTAIDINDRAPDPALGKG